MNPTQLMQLIQQNEGQQTEVARAEVTRAQPDVGEARVSLSWYNQVWSFR